MKQISRLTFGIAMILIILLLSVFSQHKHDNYHIDLPEEISQVSNDSLNATQLNAFKRNDTIFIYFIPK